MADEQERPYLFVSYARADEARVRPVVATLETAGVRVWLDRAGIHGGENYAVEIAEAIKGAAMVALFASPASLASRNVRQEIALAWRFEKAYLPLLLEPVTIPDDLAYWLEASQWIELLDHPPDVWLPAVAHALQPLGISLQLAPALTKATAAIHERPLLVGREREQGFLREHLDRMLAGQGSVVLVGGEAGIGKTTLVEDLSVQAEEQGALVLWGHAYDLSVTPPYGPWLELFHQYRRLGGALARGPDFFVDTDAAARVGSQATLFAAIADFLRGVAVKQPLVLVLDDLHWADQASLDFFRFLAHQVATQHILLVATYRSDELTRRHPLYTLLPLLVREAGAVRLEVCPLDVQGHRALIQHHYRLAPADQDRLEHFLAERAEGNPLFAGELLKTLEADGVLTQVGSGWELGDLERVHVPLLLMQVIEGRLVRLSEETRRLLQVAAVIGQDVPLELWQQVSGATDEQLVTAIEEGQGAQLLVEAAGGERYRFRHALLREALYQETVAPRRRVWHRQVGEALAAGRSPDPDAVAHHFQQAGDPRALDWLLKAGERARVAYSWVTAAERLEAALALMTAEGAPAAERSIVVFRIAMLNRYVAPHRALTLMREARSLAEEVGQAGLAALTLIMEGIFQSQLGDMRAGLVTMEAGAGAAARLSEAERTGLTAIMQRPATFPDAGIAFGPVVLWLAIAGQLQKALALGEQRVATVTSSELPIGQGGSPYGGSPYAGGWQGLALAYALLGRPQPAQHAFTQARAALQAVDDQLQVAQNYQYELALLQLPYFADHPAEQRRQLVAEGMAAARIASGVAPAGLPAQRVALPLLLLQGDWDQAKTVATRVSELDTWVRRTYADEVLVQLAWAQGDTALATRVIDGVFPAGPSTEPGNTNLAAALQGQRLAAGMALDNADLLAARAWLEAHDRWLGWSGAVLGQAEGTLLWAQYHLANDDPVQARAAAEQALEHASDPRQPLALIAVHRFLGQLDIAAKRYEQAEEHLQPSLALAEACQAPFERALTLQQLAELRAAQEKPDAALELLAEVRTLCEPLEARLTLERVAVLEQQLTVGGRS